MFEINQFRNQFPFIQQHKGVYFDSAATSQKPISVINAMTEYYQSLNINVGRSSSQLHDQNQIILDKARDRILKYYNATADYGLVFIPNASHGFNLLAHTLMDRKQPCGHMVGSVLEHHSNYLPWLNLAKKGGVPYHLLDFDNEGDLNIEELISLQMEDFILSITAQSNVTGYKPDLSTIAEIALGSNATFIIDATQSGLSNMIDIAKIKPDFLIGSSHKMYGPVGASYIIGKLSVFEELSPFLLGGGMVLNIDQDGFIPKAGIAKFEVGTTNMAAIYALSRALDFIEEHIDDDAIAHLDKLKAYAFKRLTEIDDLEWISPHQQPSCVMSFNIKGIHPHDVSTYLSEKNIIIRAGHLCALPYLRSRNLNACNRISLNFYNDFHEIEEVSHQLKSLIGFFHGR